VKIIYGLYYIEVILQGFELERYVLMKYRSFIDILQGEEKLSLAGNVIFLDRLLFGNKKMPFYGNLLLGISLSLFPITNAISWYYLL